MKLGHLRKSTIEIIKIRNLDRCQRQSKSIIGNPNNVGLHLDDDNVLISNLEEDWNSYMGKSGSDGKQRFYYLYNPWRLSFCYKFDP